MKCIKYEICANLREMYKILNLCKAGNAQKRKSMQICGNCTKYEICAYLHRFPSHILYFPANLHVILIVVSIYVWSKSKLTLHLRVRQKSESVFLNDYAHGYPTRPWCTDQFRIWGERFSDTLKLYLKIMMARVNNSNFFIFFFLV